MMACRAFCASAALSPERETMEASPKQAVAAEERVGAERMGAERVGEGESK